MRGVPYGLFFARHQRPGARRNLQEKIPAQRAARERPFRHAGDRPGPRHDARHGRHAHARSARRFARLSPHAVNSPPWYGSKLGLEYPVIWPVLKPSREPDWLFVGVKGTDQREPIRKLEFRSKSAFWEAEGGLRLRKRAWIFGILGATGEKARKFQDEQSRRLQRANLVKNRHCQRTNYC